MHPNLGPNLGPEFGCRVEGRGSLRVATGPKFGSSVLAAIHAKFVLIDILLSGNLLRISSSKIVQALDIIRVKKVKFNTVL